MLLLPWAGYEYLGQMSRTMMDGVAGAQNVRAQAIISYLQSRPQLFLPLLSPVGGERVFFSQSPRAPVVDAEFDEWSSVTDQPQNSGSRASFARVRDTLYVALQFGASELESEQSAMRLHTRERIYRLLFLSEGAVVAASNAANEFQLQDAVLGSWKSIGETTRVEIALPAEITGGVFGLELVTSGQIATWGLSNDNRPLSWVTEQPELMQVLDIFRVEDGKMEILTTDNWVVASSGQISQLARSRTLWEAAAVNLLKPGPGNTAQTESTNLASVQSWNLDSEAPSLVTEMPIAVGGLIVGKLRMESSLNQFLEVYSAAMKRFLLVSSGLILAVAIVLFAYSSWLSRRVRRLSGWAQKLVDEQGQLNDESPASSAPDEIGDLSRAYAELTQRLKKHTEYLQGLAGRLSHEIRTPLTIIGSSLENLEDASTESERLTYTKRARQGLERLRSLLRRMSEVTTLEAGIDNTPRQNFDPDSLVAELVSSYQQGFAEHRLDYQRNASGPQARVDGSPDLLAQLLDKLIENAVSFSPPGSVISISSGPQKGLWSLEVSNPGPLLPDSADSDIFASMVSLRNSKSDGEPHLGLGLTIVKRITEFHRAKITAFNRADGSGVVFRFELPRGS
jgi:two-component system sensor histidine kinase ChvG